MSCFSCDVPDITRRVKVSAGPRLFWNKDHTCKHRVRRRCHRRQRLWTTFVHDFACLPISASVYWFQSATRKSRYQIQVSPCPEYDQLETFAPFSWSNWLNAIVLDFFRSVKLVHIAVTYPPKAKICAKCYIHAYIYIYIWEHSNALRRSDFRCLLDDLMIADYLILGDGVKAGYLYCISTNHYCLRFGLYNVPPFTNISEFYLLWKKERKN